MANDTVTIHNMTSTRRSAARCALREAPIRKMKKGQKRSDLEIAQGILRRIDAIGTSDQTIDLSGEEIGFMAYALDYALKHTAKGWMSIQTKLMHERLILTEPQYVEKYGTIER